jgi:hypothetical protein
MAIVPIQGQWEDIVREHGDALRGQQVVIYLQGATFDDSPAGRQRRESFRKGLDQAHELTKDCAPLRFPISRQEMYEDPD